MKKYILSALVCLFVSTASAQDVVSSFLEKFGKDDSLEIVSIGKKMLQIIEAMAPDDPELVSTIKGLENIRIVSSKDQETSKEYYSSAYDLLKSSKGFEEILSVQDDSERLIIMTKEAKGVIKELVLLAGETGDFSLISLTGDINLETLSKLSKSLNISGLEMLDSAGKSN